MEDGKPCMFRGREIPSGLVGDISLPHIFVIALPYPITDPTGLPTGAQYNEIEAFERRCIDRVEEDRLGILTFVRTFNGTIRYFLYVSDINVVSQAIEADVNSVGAHVAAGDDSEWREFKAFLRGMR